VTIFSIKDISIIIPILNEAKTLPSLLNALIKQSQTPNEVIFVDSGSSDSSKELIDQFSKDLQILGGSTLWLENLKGMPGGNRNLGAQTAKNDWVIFLDAGITPTSNWIESLVSKAETTQSKAIFAKCLFKNDQAFQKSVCATSYGCTTLPILPASLFHKSIFSDIGWFNGNIRAGEDRLWLPKLDKLLGGRALTDGTVCVYDHFPSNSISVAKKWWVYQQHVIDAGVFNFKAWVLLVFGLTALTSYFVEPKVTAILLVIYIVLRGILDPIRRSKSFFWWINTPSSFFMAIWVAFLMDISTLAKIVTYGPKYTYRRIYCHIKTH
jgi:glycosyltransferase involved in cell wall biosynthesis